MKKTLRKVIKAGYTRLVSLPPEFQETSYVWASLESDRRLIIEPAEVK